MLFINDQISHFYFILRNENCTNVQKIRFHENLLLQTLLPLFNSSQIITECMYEYKLYIVTMEISSCDIFCESITIIISTTYKNIHTESNIQ
jgi:hypothetical protein